MLTFGNTGKKSTWEQEIGDLSVFLRSPDCFNY